MFKKGTKVRISKDSVWHPGKSGVVVGDHNTVDGWTIVNADGLDLAIDNHHITPIDFDDWKDWGGKLRSVGDDWSTDTDNEIKDCDSKLRHLLTIKGTTHILTNKELRNIKNLLAWM